MEAFLSHLDEEQARCAPGMPSITLANQFTNGLYEWLFPVTGTSAPGTASVRYGHLRAQLEALLLPVQGQLTLGIKDTMAAFFKEVPHIYALLNEDAVAFFQNDPAATDTTEVLAAYPGFKAIAVYRLANSLFRLKVPLLPRLMSEYAHSRTGIDIHPGATIGHSFFIDHGTGVVIGATTEIGNQVRIYQGVTLGALQVDKSMADTKRHPTIQDHCVLYANCTILGGKTVIGHDSVIGGNTWLTESVPPFSLVLHQAQVKVRSRDTKDAISFII